MEKASDIIDFVGKDAAAVALGISQDAIRVRLAQGKLPASWYHALERLAGRPLPRSAFSFKGAAE